MAPRWRAQQRDAVLQEREDSELIRFLHSQLTRVTLWRTGRSRTRLNVEANGCQASKPFWYFSTALKDNKNDRYENSGTGTPGTTPQFTAVLFRDFPKLSICSGFHAKNPLCTPLNLRSLKAAASNKLKLQAGPSTGPLREE